MTEGGGLCPLEMGITGHHGVGGTPPPYRTSNLFQLQSPYPAAITGIGVFHIQARSTPPGRSGCAGMQTLCPRRRCVASARPSIFMWMSSARVDGHLSLLDISQNAPQSVPDGRPHPPARYACFGPAWLHGAMEPAMSWRYIRASKRDGGIEIVHLVVQPPCGTGLPTSFIVIRPLS